MTTRTKKGDKWYCDLHPDVETYYVKLKRGFTFRCDECEITESFGMGYNETGRTSPHILTPLEKAALEYERKQGRK